MDLAAIMSSPLKVKIVAFVHFILLALAMFGGSNAYLFYNCLFMVALFWTIHCKDSIDAAHTAALIDLTSLFFDVIAILLHFWSFSGWPVIFAILNLLIRPFSILLLHREFVDRGGSHSTGSVFPTQSPRSYEDIDRTHNQSVPPI